MVRRSSKGMSLLLGFVFGLGSAEAGLLPEGLTPADFANAPVFAHASLSPQGRFLGFVAQRDGQQHVTVRNLATRSDRVLLSTEPQRERIRWCGWSGEGILLCGTVLPFSTPQGIGERTRLYSLEMATGRTRQLNQRLGTALQDQVIDLTPDRPESVLLQYDPAGTGYPRVAEMDVLTSELTPVVASHPPVRRWLSDGRGQIRLGIGYVQGSGELFRRSGSEDEWKLFLKQDISDPELIGPLSFGANASELLVLKQHLGRAALFSFDIARANTPQLLFAHPRFDIAGPLVLDPATGELLAVRYLADQMEVQFFDEREEARQLSVDRLLPGRTNIPISRTRDGDRWLVESASALDAPSLYLFDTARQELELVGHQFPGLEGREFGTMQPVIYAARDGQVIPAFLTLPPGRPARQLPAVVLPHGGPESRDHVRFDPLVQFLTLQGYAVLQMNFRGSVGYGARYAAAGAGQWGGIVHNDITDGARWLVSEGIADATRVCIVGSSFGGYAAMLGAMRESQWYVCAVSYAGISDLLSLAASAERSADSQLWRERLGEDQLALWQMSPLSRARGADTPVLLIHGRMDAVIPDRQSVRFARELRQEGKKVTLERRSDCDHDMTIQTCRVFFFERLMEFLNRELN